MKIYQKIANLQIARLNFLKNDNKEWFDKHTESIEKIMKNFGPSGSGLDSGTTFYYETSNHKCLIFITSYHVMNSDGYYTDWISPITVKVTPSFNDIDIQISGPFGKDQDIKDIIFDRFYDFLVSEIE